MEKNNITKYLQNFRCGIVAKCDNSGLGVLAFDFFRNFMVEKVLTVTGAYQSYYDRYEGYGGTTQIICERSSPSLEEIDKFLEGLDVIVAFETPYNWNLFSKAKEKGIKTVLIPMYEWTPVKDRMPVEPDLYICPSELDLKEIDGNKTLIHTPINLKLIPYKERDQAKVFVFNNGHGGFNGRNSLAEFLQALAFVKSDIKVIIRSQIPFESINDSRIEVREGDLSYEDLWSEGDVCVHLHKFDGLSLPLNEAMAAGMPILGVDNFPQNLFLAPELLVKPDAIARVQLARVIDSAVLSPLKIAEKIDEIANMSPEKIKEISGRMRKVAEGWSWDIQKLKFIETIENICKKEQL